MKHYAIITAGGSGIRFGAQTPKQFLPLKGLPILMRTINAFFNFDNSIEIVLTLPTDYVEFWDLLCNEFKFKIVHKKVIGGETRFHSVKNGLEIINDIEGLVAVHDAVRPLVSHEIIERCFNTARLTGNAIPVVKMNDSIRELKNSYSTPANRDSFVMVQTPQVFNIKILKEAYQQPYIPDFTDDAHVVEKTGIKINLVEGDRKNIKITSQSDLLIAEAFLNEKPHKSL